MAFPSAAYGRAHGLSHSRAHTGAVAIAPEPAMHQTHFLLSAEARTLSMREVFAMNDAQAFGLLRAVRWGRDADPVCPVCGVADAHWFLASRQQWRCRACGPPSRSPPGRYSPTTSDRSPSLPRGHRDLRECRQRVVCAAALRLRAARSWPGSTRSCRSDGGSDPPESACRGRLQTTLERHWLKTVVVSVEGKGASRWCVRYEPRRRAQANHRRGVETDS